MFIITETKTTSTRRIRETWAGATVEEIPQIRKTWREPRAGVEMKMRPTLVHAGKYIYNEQEENCPGVIQAITVGLPEPMRDTV